MGDGTGAPRRLTVMQIIPALDSGGAELGTVQIGQGLVAAGHRAVVVTRGGRMEKDLADCGATPIHRDVGTKNPLRIVANGFMLARLAREHDADLLHVRSRAPAWSTLIASALTGLPYVATYHTIYRENSALKRLYNSAMVRGRRVIAVGDEAAKAIRARYGLDEARVATIHRAVDLALFDPAKVTPARKAALAAIWGLAGDDEVVLLPGRLVHRKGLHVMVRAAKRLVEAGHDRLVVIAAGDDQGKTRYRDEVVSQIAALGLGRHVRLVGHCDDMPAAYALSRVAVSAAVESEGLQRAMLEAQAMGVPVVVSDVGSGVEAVQAPPRVPEAQASGLNVPAGDDAALADAVSGLLRLPVDRYAALSARAAAWSRGRFSRETFVAKTLALYREVVAEAAGEANPSR